MGDDSSHILLVVVAVPQANRRGHSNAALISNFHAGLGRGGAYLACGLPLTAITVPKTAMNQNAGTKLRGPKWA